ncbi:MAG: F0F1 ATP synthase subunit gamma [Desulfonauticus sp.]|nr:F0F1 ATP synthase subunit gamma [Desulfonauticus sp.]
MGESLRDIQRKIQAVKKTKQITKAMNMVASAKLRNAQLRIERFRPYADKYFEVISDLAGRVDASSYPLLEKREEIKTVGIVLITSDKGLCGAFNANLCTAALKLAQSKQSEGKEVKFICIGKRARDFFRKTEFEILEEKIEVLNHFDFQLANEVGETVIDKFLARHVDEVYVVFGKFVTIIKQEPTIAKVLPVESGAKSGDSSSEYVFEPSVEGLLTELLPRYVKVQIYRALLDTSASEHAARMTAMDNATKNCNELVNSLTLVYNKARQASITAELMDIVGGAEALKNA